MYLSFLVFPGHGNSRGQTKAQLIICIRKQNENNQKRSKDTLLVVFVLVLQRGLEPRTPCLKGRIETAYFLSFSHF